MLDREVCMIISSNKPIDESIDKFENDKEIYTGIVLLEIVRRI